ncbi:MAG: bifunctional glutamate N-acetyltransferase/amino-acid acetyltransferase ArgJ, partial [Pseudanabaenaceae cyanobacterium]
ACVDYDRRVLGTGEKVKAILCNAGQANACTGKVGEEIMQASIRRLQEVLGTQEHILVASTGVIGRQIDRDKFLAAIPQAVAALSREGGMAAAQAIVTTDLVTKVQALETEIEGVTVRMGGMAKGSGMIHPQMATMLAFITCDAPVAGELWQAMLRRATDKSFNQITVDGDTSTNDLVLALCNDRSGFPLISEPNSEAAKKIESMLTDLCIYLAKKVARDGEGATCLIEVRVEGASSDEEARQIARTIASSSLLKAAIFGRDPNWGRIAAAAGRSGVTFDPSQLRIQLGNYVLMEQGQPLDFDRAGASQYLKEQAERSGQEQNIDHPVVIQVKIGEGQGQGIAWGCDLTYDYVRINAEYTT